VTKAEEIIAQIERNLVGMEFYGHWTIGVTASPDLTEADLDYPAFWRFWPAATPGDAQEAKAYFQRKGMKDGGERGQRATNIFLY
jgi:hypothetical protein